MQLRNIKNLPPEYWWGWRQGGYAESHVVEHDPEDQPPPLGVSSKDPEIMKEMQESAFKTVVKVDAKRMTWSKDHIKYPEIKDLDLFDKEIQDRILEIYKDKFHDPVKWRRHMFEAVRHDILQKLMTSELREPVVEAKRRVEMLKYGMSLSEEHRMDMEETVQETLGFEVPEEPRFVGKYSPRMPPPGPEPAGRGCFFIVQDGSGSMVDEECDSKRHLDRFDVGSAIIWTFIQEAKAINRSGRSHYIGIYGFNSCMYYPLPISEFPDATPFNPLPCDKILAVEEDFLRCWPLKAGDADDADTGWTGGTNWEFTFPAIYADYVRFGGGDLIILADGDVGTEKMYLEDGNKDAAKTFPAKFKFSMPKDDTNPTILMKLQKFMHDRDCGTGYLFWIVPEFTPEFRCPKCSSVNMLWKSFNRDDNKHQYFCRSCQHEWWESMGEECGAAKFCRRARASNHFGCEDCRYFHLVLAGMFNGGKNIFKGTTVSELLESAAKAIVDTRKRRLQRNETEEIPVQDDEDD